MYVNGLRFRAIERVIGVAHTTVIGWLQQVGANLPDTYDPEAVPQVSEWDELEPFVGQKRNNVWIWTVVDHCRPGILGWAVGDHSAEPFQPLWQAVAVWQCCF